LKHDFGGCLLYQRGRTAPTTTLLISNNDSVDISFDSTFQNSDELECDAAASVLGPRESKQVKFVFYPREVRAYSFNVVFDVNSHDRVELELLGEGVELGIELADPRAFSCAFGAVRVDRSAEKLLRVTNSGKVQTSFALTDETIAALQQACVSIEPSGPILLKSRESCSLTVRFAPTTRVSSFKHDVVFSAEGIRRTLAAVSGVGHGIEAKLETESLYFGAVAKGSRATRKLLLENVGDVPTKFRWDTTKLAKEFSISPVEGSLAAHSSVTLEVAMHPSRVMTDIRADKVPCSIDGGAALSLSLSGACATVEPESAVLAFVTPVRQAQSKTITAQNKTSSPWLVRPVITNDLWSGAETFEVKAGSSGTYEVTYRPFKMTADTPHEGTVFLPFPDGSGMLYKLTGQADTPLSNGSINREVAAKKTHIEMVSVRNWLDTPQRFSAVMQRVGDEDASVQLRGTDSIDVPPNTERDYKINFYAHKEGTTKAKVTFKNEKTGEFQFYDVEFKAKEAGVLGTLALQTVVRESSVRTVSVSNPLATPVTMTCTATSSAISVEPKVTVDAGAEVQLAVTYRPLLKAVGEKARLTLQCAELGIYTYDLVLTATERGSDGSLQFKTPFGTSSSQTFRFISYSKDKCDYKCSTDSADFVVEPAMVAASGAPSVDGQELCCDVRFEPSSLGESRAKLTVVSDTGGLYVCNLQGICQAPKPQGPIEVRPGATAPITIKNPTAAPLAFAFAVDNPAFKLSAATGQAAPKASASVNVTFTQPAPGVAVSAKLTATAPGCPPWVYYLKGWDNPNAPAPTGKKK
jgi:hydrocephalus-inducing protein